MNSVMVRFVEDRDAEGIQAIYGPLCLHSPITFELDPPSVEEVRLRTHKIRDRYPWLVADVGGVIAGYVYASTHRDRPAYQWSVELTAYVHPNYRKRSIGRALYQALFQVLALQGYYRGFAGITLPNAASVRLHETVGMSLIGIYQGIGFKLGRWHDVGWWECSLRPDDGPPTTPKTVAEIRDLPEVSVALAAAAAGIRVTG